jgi:hypothetical protein
MRKFGLQDMTPFCRMALGLVDNLSTLAGRGGMTNVKARDGESLTLIRECKINLGLV